MLRTQLRTLFEPDKARYARAMNALSSLRPAPLLRIPVNPGTAQLEASARGAWRAIPPSTNAVVLPSATLHRPRRAQ